MRSLEIYIFIVPGLRLHNQPRCGFDETPTGCSTKGVRRPKRRCICARGFAHECLCAHVCVCVRVFSRIPALYIYIYNVVNRIAKKTALISVLPCASLIVHSRDLRLPCASHHRAVVARWRSRASSIRCCATSLPPSYIVNSIL